MPQVVRVALPGYDALTDTNPDHFALYADEEWILIKEYARGKETMTNSLTISHNMGYVPFTLLWATIGNNRILLSGGELTGTYNITYYVNDENIVITNGTGSAAVIDYFIFYDQQGPGTQSSKPLPEHGLVVAKPGFNALESDNPNDVLFRSDLNTFKILYTNTVTFTLTASSTETKSTPQLVWFNKNPAVIAFARKSGSNYVIGPSQFTNSSWGPSSDNYKFFSVWADNNNIFFNTRNDNGSNINVTFRYYLFEV